MKSPNQRRDSRLIVAQAPPTPSYTLDEQTITVPFPLSIEVLDRLLGEDACDEAVVPALEVAGDVLEGLADADGSFEKRRVAAELFHGDFEGELGAGLAAPQFAIDRLQ